MSTEVHFYHLTKAPLEKALPQLVYKAIDSGKKIVLMAPDELRVKSLDSLLWSFSTTKFVPHGTANDDFPEKQPVYLTAAEENPNKAAMLFVVGGLQPAHFRSFERVVDMFDGNNPADTEQARGRWQHYQSLAKENQEISLVYWKQDPAGSWMRAT